MLKMLRVHYTDVYNRSKKGLMETELTLHRCVDYTDVYTTQMCTLHRCVHYTDMYTTQMCTTGARKD